MGLIKTIGEKTLTRRQLLVGSLAAAGATGGGTAAYAAGEAAFQLKVTSYHLQPPGWRRDQPLSIAVIADLHAGGPNVGLERIQEIVERTNALRADLVVLLGDYFATHKFVTETVPHPVWAGELARLTAPLGVFSILGNHDWWHDIAGVRSALFANQIPLLENDAVLLGAPGRRFWLAGLGDQIAIRTGRSKFRGVDDLPGTLRKVTTDDPVIMLAHEPDIFAKMPSRVALMLAGHTHGAQVRVPFVWPYFVPSAYRGRYAYGHIVENERHLVVSGGLGTSILPVRLGVPPEIVHIRLGAV